MAELPRRLVRVSVRRVGWPMARRSQVYLCIAAIAYVCVCDVVCSWMNLPITCMRSRVCLYCLDDNDDDDHRSSRSGTSRTYILIQRSHTNTVMEWCRKAIGRSYMSAHTYMARRTYENATSNIVNTLTDHTHTHTQGLLYLSRIGWLVNMWFASRCFYMFNAHMHTCNLRRIYGLVIGVCVAMLRLSISCFTSWTNIINARGE